MKTDPRTTAGRAFVRSLNILLKFARLYGYDNARTAEQLRTAWNELQAAIPNGTENGLLLGATGSQLLLDGVPLEGTPAEKQFAQLLSAVGLASIQFHSVRDRGRAGELHAIISHWKSETGGIGATVEGGIGLGARNAHQRDLLCGDRFTIEGSEHGRSDRSRIVG